MDEEGYKIIPKNKNHLLEKMELNEIEREILWENFINYQIMY